MICKTHNNVWETGDKISKRLDHLIPALGRLEVLTRFSVALLDPFDPKAQRGCRRDRLSPNHVSVPKKKPPKRLKFGRQRLTARPRLASTQQ